MLEGRGIADRCELAESWWAEEVGPVLEELRARGICVSGADLEAYVGAVARPEGS